MFKDIAIRKVHPEVVSINTKVDGSNVARDKDWNLIELNWTKINQEESKLLADYEKQAYARSRANAFDPIPEQLDQIYHDMDGWKKRIKSVKDKFPKPE